MLLHDELGSLMVTTHLDWRGTERDHLSVPRTECCNSPTLALRAWRTRQLLIVTCLEDKKAWVLMAAAAKQMHSLAKNQGGKSQQCVSTQE